MKVPEEVIWACFLVDVVYSSQFITTSENTTTQMYNIGSSHISLKWQKFLKPEMGL